MSQPPQPRQPSRPPQPRKYKDVADTVEIGGARRSGPAEPPPLHPPPVSPPPAAGPARPGGAAFLSVWFRCCNVYGRMTRNPQATMYQGRCPRCAAAVSAKIGPGGTSRRIFEAR